MIELVKADITTLHRKRCQLRVERRRSGGWRRTGVACRLSNARRCPTRNAVTVMLANENKFDRIVACLFDDMAFTLNERTLQNLRVFCAGLAQ